MNDVALVSAGICQQVDEIFMEKFAHFGVNIDTLRRVSLLRWHVANFRMGSGACTFALPMDDGTRHVFLIK